MPQSFRLPLSTLTVGTACAPASAAAGYSRTTPIFRLATVGAAAIAVAFAVAGSASAYTFTTLYNFCKKANCADGMTPSARLLMDPSGDIFGTADGGEQGLGAGIVFRYVPGSGTYSVVHNFCSKASCGDGQYPGHSELIADAFGNLIGTTDGGGKHGKGVVFRLERKTANHWSLNVLHHFCAHAGCPDGARPTFGLTYAGQSSGAVWDGSSPLYGTTVEGGKYDRGVVYRLVYNGIDWQMTRLRSFRGSSNPNPQGLVIDDAGNLYGTTSNVGKYDFGEIYKLDGSNWKFGVLHNFCSLAGCPDGALPQGRLAIGGGKLFGVTLEGGSSFEGAVFQQSPGGFKVLYSFCSLANCADGNWPEGGVTPDGSGHLFGTTVDGGANSSGTVFELASGTETVLYNFCSQADCTDGLSPAGPVIVDSSGNLYGTTIYGGANNLGTLFKLSP